MPVSKKRKKKNGRPVGRPESRSAPRQGLTVAPWRAYTEATAQTEDAPGLLDLLASWPYQMSDGRGEWMTTIAEQAEKAGTTVEETIESLTTLEDSGFLFWDAPSQTTFLTTPDDVPTDEAPAS